MNKVPIRERLPERLSVHGIIAPKKKGTGVVPSLSVSDEHAVQFNSFSCSMEIHHLSDLSSNDVFLDRTQEGQWSVRANQIQQVSADGTVWPTSSRFVMARSRRSPPLFDGLPSRSDPYHTRLHQVKSIAGEIRMTLQQELTSWLSPESKKTNEAPAIGSKAPSSERLAIPSANGKSVVVTFLRHCGCPCSYNDDFLLFASCSLSANKVAPSSRRENLPQSTRSRIQQSRHPFCCRVAQRPGLDRPMARRTRRRKGRGRTAGRPGPRPVCPVGSRGLVALACPQSVEHVLGIPARQGRGHLEQADRKRKSLANGGIVGSGQRRRCQMGRAVETSGRRVGVWAGG